MTDILKTEYSDGANVHFPECNFDLRGGKRIKNTKPTEEICLRESLTGQFRLCAGLLSPTASHGGGCRNIHGIE